MMISKNSFIEYVLFNYDFIHEDAVYVLNYIKSMADLESRLSFTDSSRPIHITISEKNTKRPSIMLRCESRVLLKAEEILVFFENSTEEIFIEFQFKYLDVKYTELLFKEKNDIDVYYQLERESLLRSIEIALLQKDKTKFLTLTSELKQLDEESNNAIHKK